MHEKIKFSEAQYFYSKMVKENAIRENFCFELSAFLSAARSVLQYALKEARSKQGGEQWYGDLVSKSPTLSFFKDKRDLNIHSGPISPRTDCTVIIGESICISDSISLVLKDKDGNIKEKFDTPRVLSETNKSSPTVIGKYQHRFIDWEGKEDILELGGIYIRELEQLINDGLVKGFISL